MTTDAADALCTCGHERAWHTGSSEHPDGCGWREDGVCGCTAFEHQRPSRVEPAKDQRP